jgi:flavin-dependent dehydrogenase
VAIIGAGPAGSAAAHYLSGRGLQVLLLDRAVFPRDKVCGEAISPGALPFLESFGVLAEVRRHGAFPYRGARLSTPEGLTADARYPSAHVGLAMPRESLDWLLLQGASARVEARQGVTVEAVSPAPDAGHLLALKADGRHETLWARAVISAEGRFARILTESAREAGPPNRFAVVATLDGVDGLGDWLEFHLVAPTMQVVVAPQGPDRAAIAVVLDGPDASRRAPEAIKDFLAVLRRDPLLVTRIQDARLLKPPRGMGLGKYQPRRLVGDGWLAVGDAVGYMDPITGEGMYRAFRTAQLATETLLAAFAHGDLRASQLMPYARAVRAEFNPSYRFVDTVVALSRRPRLARFALRAIARDPLLAARMGSYQGALAPASGFYSLGTLARFAWAGLQSPRGERAPRSP